MTAIHIEGWKKVHAAPEAPTEPYICSIPLEQNLEGLGVPPRPPRHAIENVFADVKEGRGLGVQNSTFDASEKKYALALNSKV